jgi:lipopolysaccharide transport system permease protein
LRSGPIITESTKTPPPGTMRANRRERLLALLLNGLPGWILVALGLSLAGVSLFADSLGIGGQPGIIGWKQWLGAGIGAVVLAAGSLLADRLASQRYESPPPASTTSRSIRPSNARVQYYDSAAPRLPFIFELRKLFEYRFLLRNLVARDLTVRYKRSVLGLLWAMINPLLTMIVMAAVFLNLFQVRVENYPIYLVSGLLLWRLFSGGTTVAMRSVLGSADLSKKTYVPSGVFVAASVGSALVNFVFALGPLLLLAIIMGVSPKVTWLFLPIPLIEVTLLTFGIGLVVAALAVFFADILDIYEVLTNAYFYLTPIMYPVTILPGFLAVIEQFNPMYHLIDWFRSALIDGQLPHLETALLTTLGVILITAAGWSLFTRLADQFPYHA